MECIIVAALGEPISLTSRMQIISVGARSPLIGTPLLELSGADDFSEISA